MPFIIGTRKGRIAALATSVAALMLAPTAHAATAPANPYDCKPQPTLSSPFQFWGDVGQYTPLQNAGFELGSTGWTLAGGARVVADNESWWIGSRADQHSLELPAGGSAVSAPLCIDETYPHFRLFAKKLALAKGDLKMDVLFFDGKGNVKNTKAFTYTSSLTAWLPTGTVKIGLFDGGATGVAPVAFRFTAKDRGYRIDDVYVDPMSRR
jgi:hypothetical protein